MKLSEQPHGFKTHVALDRRVLAVISRRVDGWCVYIGTVPGEKHSEEWQLVASEGSKVNREIAEAIFGWVDTSDLPYAR